jgi:hypothetical protein
MAAVAHPHGWAEEFGGNRAVTSPRADGAAEDLLAAN